MLSTPLPALLLLALAWRAHADRNVTVSADSTLLTYFPGKCTTAVSDCAGYWLPVQPTLPGDVFHYAANNTNSAVTLQFQGSAIFFQTTFQSYQSTADISLDGVITRGVTWISTDADYIVNATAWSQTGLDPTMNHTISIIYSAIGFTGTTRSPRYLDLSSLIYTVPDAIILATNVLPTAITATRSGGTRSVSLSGTSTSRVAVPSVPGAPAVAGTSSAAAVGSTGRETTNTAAIVGGVLGSLLFVVLVAIGFLLRRRRRQRPQAIDLTNHRAAIDDDDGASLSSLPRAHVAAYATPPMSPVTSGSHRPGYHQRSSTGDWSICPAFAAAATPRSSESEIGQDSSIVARGSHFSSSDQVHRPAMSERGPSILGRQGSGSQQGPSRPDRDSKVGLDDIEAAAPSMRVNNPDADQLPPPAYR